MKVVGSRFGFVRAPVPARYTVQSTRWLNRTYSLGDDREHSLCQYRRYRAIRVPPCRVLFRFGTEEGGEDVEQSDLSAGNVGVSDGQAIARRDVIGPSDIGNEMDVEPAQYGKTNLILTVFRWPRHIPANSVSLKGSFDGWERDIPLSRSSPSSDWSCTIPLPPGKVHFKYIVDDRYVTSPSEPVVNDENGKFNNLRVVHASAKFRWPTSLLGGKNVSVIGEWGSWEGEPLRLDLVDRLGGFAKVSSQSHELACCLPPGEYAYQFVVDGQIMTNPAENGRDLSDREDKVNIKRVPQAPAVRIYYSTGWSMPKLKARWICENEAGEATTTEWKDITLHHTTARCSANGAGVCWKYAVVDCCNLMDPDRVSGQISIASGKLDPKELEFFPYDGETKKEDHPSTGGTYRCSFPGGFKLKSGILRPFNQSCEPPMMLVSDIDGTLVSHDENDTASTARFAKYWEDRAALTGSFLVFNTGRSFGQVMGLLEQMQGVLPIPDAIITAVGTKIFLLDREKGHRGTSSGSLWHEDLQWARSLDYRWNLEKAKEAASQVISELSQDQIAWLDDGSEHPHRLALSVHINSVDLAMHLLKEKLDEQGMNYKLIVSGTMEWRYLDCVSGSAGKHAALEHLRSMYGIAVDRCVAAGDSGNDILMLEGANPAIVVGNAQPALMEWAVRQPQDGRVVVSDAGVADGVLEGLARLNLY